MRRAFLLAAVNLPAVGLSSAYVVDVLPDARFVGFSQSTTLRSAPAGWRLPSR